MFKDRKEAGQLLAEKLADTIEGSNSLIFAVPRGGVIVGREIARALNAELDVIISKKITPPDNSEFAIGAIMHDGTSYYSKDANFFLNKSEFSEEINKKKKEAQRRLEQYRGNYQYQFDNKDVILVDDGIATGSTIFVIIKWLRQQNVKNIILAIPVMPLHTYELLQTTVNKIIALQIPPDFSAVGQFYEKFEQVTDKEVLDILREFKN